MPLFYPFRPSLLLSQFLGSPLDGACRAYGILAIRLKIVTAEVKNKGSDPALQGQEPLRVQVLFSGFTYRLSTAFFIGNPKAVPPASP
jgi:hypothetical protein